jgi:hypothetical protein
MGRTALGNAYGGQSLADSSATDGKQMGINIQLVHLLTPKHGKLFKSFMYAYLPHWEKHEEQLQILAARAVKTKRHLQQCRS